MAWLQADPSGNFHISFRFGGKKFKRSLRTKNEDKADGSKQRLEENIALIESGRLEVPTGADIPSFLLSDGKLNGKPKAPPVVRLAEVFAAYQSSLPVDSLEPETIRIGKIHMGHIQDVLGGRFVISRVAQGDLQDYVVKRSKAKGKRGRPLSATTIKKELSTFSTVWSWAKKREYVSGEFPNSDLRFPKTTEKPPFQTWAEIERQIALGGLTEGEQAELWDCLYLTLSEIDEVLSHIETHSEYGFLYPMAVMAGHTGTRRSELCRSRMGDFDLDGGMVRIREKKRVKGRRTTRQAPLSSKLKQVISTWFENKRASIYSFPRELKVHRKRKPRVDADAVGADEASHHLEQALSDSKWERIRGWHIFRHSFISNCAAKGTDQRMIDRWTGHQTEEMRQRYTHLFPDSQREALQGVFG